MLERICRRLVSAGGGDPDEVTDGIPAWERVEYLGRAVLEEMREPDEAMVRASRNAPGCGCPCCATAYDYYAMIDAALEGGE